MAFLFYCFTFALSSLASPASIATIAKVGDQVITTRDLQIDQFLNEVDNPIAPFMDKKDPLKEITWEYLIYKESQALGQGVTESEVQSSFKQVKRHVETDKLWRSLQVGDKALMEAVRRKSIVKHFIDLKMPHDLVDIDEDSVEAYYTQNRAQLGNRPLTEVHDKIVKGLKEQKMQERFRDWMNAITRTHGVVYFSGVKIQ